MEQTHWGRGKREGGGWVGYGHRGCGKREIGSRGMEGFEKENKKNKKIINNNKTK